MFCAAAILLIPSSFQRIPFRADSNRIFIASYGYHVKQCFIEIEGLQLTDRRSPEMNDIFLRQNRFDTPSDIAYISRV